MIKGYKKYILLGIVIMLLLGGCGRNEAPEEKTGVEAESEVLPDEGVSEDAIQEDEGLIFFEGQDTEGNIVSSSVLSESKITMVNVWATYCNPCLREMPGLGELAKEYDPGDFQIIGIISDVQEGASEKALEYAVGLIEQTGADYPHLLLNESLYRALLTEVNVVPTTFFLDADGKVLDIVIGSMEKTAWEEKVNGLLEKE